MNKTQNIAIIDIGKTNIKIVLVNLNSFTELIVLSEPNVVANKGLYPHYDTDKLWKFIKSSLGTLYRRYSFEAITVTTHGAAVALIDKNGRLILPIIDYEFDGPDTLCKDYEKIRPNFKETGTPKAPLGVVIGAQIFWQKKFFPQSFKSLKSIITYPQYWVGLLTGKWCTEVSYLGCHSDLWLPFKNRFSSLVTDLGINKRIGSIRKANDIIGSTLPIINEELGIKKSIPVYCGIHDSNASLFRHLIEQDKPFSLVTTGTWVIIMSVGGEKKTFNPNKDILINVDAFGNPVPSARFMGGREFEIVTKNISIKPTAVDITSVFNKSIFLFPALVPQYGPFKGRESHWSISENKINEGEKVVAVSYYLAMVTLVSLEALGAKGSIIIEGPFTRNKFYLDLMATVLEADLYLSEGSLTGTSIGSTLLINNNTSNLYKIKKYNNPEGEYKQNLINYSKKWKQLVDK